MRERESSAPEVAGHASANIVDLWDPLPFQISLQAQDGDGASFGPESNRVIWCA